MILEGIVSLITAPDSPLYPLIGTRIYPEVLPNDPVLPALTYYISGGSSEPTFDTSGLQKLRVHFDSNGDTYASTCAVREALHKLLNGYQGLLTDGTYLGFCQYIGPIDSPYGQKTRQFRHGAEFYFFYNFSD